MSECQNCADLLRENSQLRRELLQERDMAIQFPIATALQVEVRELHVLFQDALRLLDEAERMMYEENVSPGLDWHERYKALLPLWR